MLAVIFRSSPGLAVCGNLGIDKSVSSSLPLVSTVLLSCALVRQSFATVANVD